MNRRLLDPLVQPVHDRLTLLLNHVIGAEPQAMQRLRPHAGQRMVFVAQGWRLGFAVTPAGLLEAWPAEDGAAADLTLSLTELPPGEAARRMVRGERPRFDIQGDGAFAETVSWLVTHLRWDIEDDVARVIGDAPAHQLAQVARVAAQGLRGVAQQAVELFDRGGFPGQRPR